MDFKSIKIEMGRRLKVLRHTKGLNQTELANMLGTSQNIISTWETGRFFIPWNVAYKMFSIFDMSFSFFDLGEDFKNGRAYNYKSNNGLSVKI